PSSTPEHTAMEQEQEQEQEQEAIPTYAEASQPAPPLPTAADEPPAYTFLDSSQTTFSIRGTFIHTVSGPCYQLSSPLDQRGPDFRIRRLRAKEVSQIGVTPVAFASTSVLYEVNVPPLLVNEFHIRGFTRTCLPGMLEMKWRLGKWHVSQVARYGAKGKEILSLKVGGWGSAKLARRKEEGRSEWKDAGGRVLATEKLQSLEDGSVLPVVELGEGLDQTWRELLITLWATRLWIAFG
ncbi:hypothetical protein BDV96DRAFT_462434, partial [Lophiotrema nucula]